MADMLSQKECERADLVEAAFKVGYLRGISTAISLMDATAQRGNVGTVTMVVLSVLADDLLERMKTPPTWRETRATGAHDG